MELAELFSLHWGGVRCDRDGMKNSLWEPCVVQLKLVALVGIIGLFCVTAEATTYRGTITQTIRPFEDESGWLTQFERGWTFIGYYQYESDTIDGTYVYSYDYTPVGSINTLQGSLFLPQPDNALYGTYSDWWDLKNTRNTGELTVVDGVVEGFHWSYEQGAIYSVFSQTSFFVLLYGDFFYFNGTGAEEGSDWCRVDGTIAFGAPREVFAGSPAPNLIARAPDSFSVLPCLMVALLGLVVRRQRTLASAA